MLTHVITTLCLRCGDGCVMQDPQDLLRLVQKGDFHDLDHFGCFHDITKYTFCTKREIILIGARLTCFAPFTFGNGGVKKGLLDPLPTTKWTPFGPLLGAFQTHVCNSGIVGHGPCA